MSAIGALSTNVSAGLYARDISSDKIGILISACRNSGKFPSTTYKIDLRYAFRRKTEQEAVTGEIKDRSKHKKWNESPLGLVYKGANRRFH